MIKLNVRYFDSLTIQNHKMSMKISCIWLFAIRFESNKVSSSCNSNPSHIECPFKAEPK